MPAWGEPLPTPKQGELRVVTYNVAGLPEGISNVHPTRTLPLVGPALSRYDLALVQEDFAYPELLRSGVTLPQRTPGFERKEQLHFGDGLSLFARLPLGDVRRQKWQACHGVVDAYFDCLTPKGLTMARSELSPGIGVDVYDVHLDAGDQAGDVAARRAQLAQLLEAIETWSGEHAVLLGGDFNLGSAEVADFRKLFRDRGFLDACDELHCREPSRLDRVLYRGNKRLGLRARSWKTDGAFKDAQGRPLSDHLAVAVTLSWRTKGGP